MDGTRLARWILAILLFIFMTINLGLSGAIIQQQTRHGSPVRINFAIFCAVFGLLTLILYTIPSLFIRKLFSPLVSLILDTLNWIFFLSGGIALAAQLRGQDCSKRSFLRWNPITNGGDPNYDHSWEKRCREGGALTGFMWFAAAAWFGLFLCALVEHNRNKGDSSRRRVDMRGSGMRQI